MTKRYLAAEMDKSVKRMLKLIDEEGDSFAKKAEMYYQKRPELVSHVEEFYRMYRSLAERYDHVTGELRKNIPSDLQSQGSTVSDSGSDLPSVWPSPSPSPSPEQQKLGRRKSGIRAAGFDFFLGSNGGVSGSDMYQKADDESSTLTESDRAESDDDDSVNNYSVVSGNGNGSDPALHRKVVELEIELRDVKEKLVSVRNEDSVDGGSSSSYERELTIAREKLRNSEEEVSRLYDSLQKYELGGAENSEESADRGLVEELRISKGKLRVSENEIASLRYELERNKEKIRHLQDQLESGLKDVIASKAKLNAERREVSKLQERVSRLKGSLSGRDREIMDLKIAVSDAEMKIFPETAQVKAELSKLVDERVRLVEHVRELENQGRCFEDEIRTIRAERSEMESRLGLEIDHLRKEAAESCELIGTLKESVDSLRAERDGLGLRVAGLVAELASGEGKIGRLGEELRGLENERLRLVDEAREACVNAEKLGSRIAELEKEMERQRDVISERGEEKREAIRQLCLYMEHYRNGYVTLRRAFPRNAPSSCLCFC